MITMSAREEGRLRVLEQMLHGKLTQVQAAELLEVSVRPYRSLHPAPATGALRYGAGTIRVPALGIHCVIRSTAADACGNASSGRHDKPRCLPRQPGTQTVATSAQFNPMQSLVEGGAIVGLRGRSEPEANVARMGGGARQRGRGAQGAEQAEGPAIALPFTSDVY